MADEEALRKIRSVEEQIDMLNKKLSIAKQVCGQIFFWFLCILFPTMTRFDSLCHHFPPCPGGGRPAERDGCDGPGLRGYAGTEHSPDAAAQRER